MSQTEQEETNPRLSLIMPVRNEEAAIQGSLVSVLDQSYDELEVLVVDGQSTDRTLEIVDEVVRRYPQRSVQVLSNPKRTAPHALNMGIRAATGDFVMRVDGHAELAPKALERLLARIQESKAMCVGGVLVTWGEGSWGKAIATAMSCGFGVGNASFRTGTGTLRPVDTVAFGVYRRDVFEAVGLFDEELTRNQDDEFNYRVTQAGGTILLDPGVQVRYQCRDSWTRLAKQYFQYGFWKVKVLQKRRGLPSVRGLVPPAFVLGLILFMILGLGLGRWWPFLGLSATYFAVSMGFSFLAPGLGSLANRGRLPVVFLTMHGTYGAGFLAGLFSAALSWRSTSVSDPPSQGDVFR